MDVLHLFLHSGVNGDWVVPIDYYAATMNIYIQFFLHEYRVFISPWQISGNENVGSLVTV